MRTQEEINIASLQKHIRDAFIIAKFMGLEETSDLLEQVFSSITPNSIDQLKDNTANN